LGGRGAALSFLYFVPKKGRYVQKKAFLSKEKQECFLAVLYGFFSDAGE
jgi:hypothetical protein